MECCIRWPSLHNHPDGTPTMRLFMNTCLNHCASTNWLSRKPIYPFPCSAMIPSLEDIAPPPMTNTYWSLECFYQCRLLRGEQLIIMAGMETMEGYRNVVSIGWNHSIDSSGVWCCLCVSYGSKNSIPAITMSLYSYSCCQPPLTPFQSLLWAILSSAVSTGF